MDESLLKVKERIQNSLDDLLSPRATNDLKSQALKDLERQLAICVHGESSGDMQNLIALQYTFECNIPSRLLPWIAASTTKLESISNEGFMDADEQNAALDVAQQLALSLSLIQGIILKHQESKQYLGRKCALEILLDLLLASRHLSSISSTSDADSSKPTAGRHPLTSIVLDTLLCVLVDSSPALRAFEESNGPQAVVKILKRAGTPREVRMKCLEFLYFYLLDETTTSASTGQEQPLPANDSTLTPTAPSTPLQSVPTKPYLNGTPRRPVSRYGSSTFSLTSSEITVPTSSSSRSTSGSSTNSFSSTSSNASSSTAPSTCPSVPSSPKKHSQISNPHTPVLRPLEKPRRIQSRPLMMLKKDVDFVPISPRKPDAGRPVAGHLRAKSASRSRSKLGSDVLNESDQRNQAQLARSQPTITTMDEAKSEDGRQITRRVIERVERTRTTEEKKEILGTMLGNVDALVESVRKAGIWGLG